MKRSLYLVGLCVIAGCLDWAPPDVLPSINGIEGVGPAEAIAPRPEDEAAWEAHAGDRVPAARRISTADPVLLVTGSGLAGTTAARAEGEDGQGTISFEIEETSMSSVRLRFPPALGIAGGLFLLSIVTPLGEANAQVFFLQGERGADGAGLDCTVDACTVDRDLVVEGRLAVAERPMCPQGYVWDDTEPDFVLCVRDGIDEMVRVGDFWVDRYEASVWASEDCTGTQYGEEDDWATVGTFPYHGQFDTPLYACSVSGERPSRYLTWFQAQAACSASGKHLITNAEWQAAVEGTDDPAAGSTGAGGTCVTSGSLRNTGGGTRCISYWGAEDMIGNVREWVADWYGQGGNTDDGSQPAEYFGDGYWNVDAAEFQGRYGSHFPAAGLRGGYWSNGAQAGAFSVTLAHAPSNSGNYIGFRCARNH